MIISKAPKGNWTIIEVTRESKPLGVIGILGNDQQTESGVTMYPLKKFPQNGRKNREELSLKIRYKLSLKAGPLIFYNIVFNVLI